jgi:hypothetical protein
MIQMIRTRARARLGASEEAVQRKRKLDVKKKSVKKDSVEEEDIGDIEGVCVCVSSM